MPDKKKIIGLTGPSAFTQECIEAVEDFLDCNFVLLYHSNEDNLKWWLDTVDGVIIAGGIDIHPTVYNESIWTNNNLSKFDIKRDFRELSITELCIETGKPLLGICRGHQLIGLRHGLGFLMDISGSSTCHHPQRAQITTGKNEPCHYIKFISDAARDRFYQQYKMPETPPERKVIKSVLNSKSDGKLWVNSFHHQAVSYNPKRNYEEEGIDVLGIARIDFQHCKEIVELMQGKRWISVQWHPEFDFRENTVSRVILERFKELMEGGENV